MCIILQKSIGKLCIAYSETKSFDLTEKAGFSGLGTSKRKLNDKYMYEGRTVGGTEKGRQAETGLVKDSRRNLSGVDWGGLEQHKEKL